MPGALFNLRATRIERTPCCCSSPGAAGQGVRSIGEERWRAPWLLLPAAAGGARAERTALEK